MVNKTPKIYSRSARIAMHDSILKLQHASQANIKPQMRYRTRDKKRNIIQHDGAIVRKINANANGNQ